MSLAAIVDDSGSNPEIAFLGSDKVQTFSSDSLLNQLTTSLLPKQLPSNFSIIEAAAVVLMGCTSAVSEPLESIRFLPDQTDVACRALLPQCFHRQDWARLCRNQPDIRQAHSAACAEAESL